jgi:glycosyltransferase involved in cell wall biosynthesis
MKILSLHAEFSSFYGSCFRELVERTGAEILMFSTKPHQYAPFGQSLFEESKVQRSYFWNDYSFNEISKMCHDFNPDVVFMSGWIFKFYLKIAKSLKRKGVFIIAFSDSQFKNTYKQYLRKYTSAFLLKPVIDVVWTAGDRQYIYASFLGFPSHSIWTGVLSCDWKKFASNCKYPEKISKSFIYIGRLHDFKGVKILADAYMQYRKSVESPWELVCLGSGPMEEYLRKTEGVRLTGFVQPSDVPGVAGSCSCFVMPSLCDAWSVAIHEAAALALPIIATDVCGATAHLVCDGVNGYIVETGSVIALAESMGEMHKLDDEKRSSMGKYSFELSKQFTPERWVDTFLRKCPKASS